MTVVKEAATTKMIVGRYIVLADHVLKKVFITSYVLRMLDCDIIIMPYNVQGRHGCCFSL